MRLLLAALALSTGTLTLGSCQDCPDGNSGDSLFCHSGSCAAGEMVCGGACANPQTDRDNCGTCGNQCGDGLVCQSGACVEGCPGNQTSCNGVCVDTQADPDNCGGCGAAEQFQCSEGESCVSGGCVCASGVTCGGVCTDPMTSNTNCGATSTCQGANAGDNCELTEACVGGTCISRAIYRGSLTRSNGNWTYQGMPGLPGANAECEMRWPGSSVCTYEKLVMASTRPTPETINATDHAGNPVAAWWIHNPTALPTELCTNNNTRNVNDPNDRGVAWTYGTADQGHLGRFVTLTPATGAITPVQLMSGTCATAGGRHVPCCSTVIAP